MDAINRPDLSAIIAAGRFLDELPAHRPLPGTEGGKAFAEKRLHRLREVLALSPADLIPHRIIGTGSDDGMLAILGESDVADVDLAADGLPPAWAQTLTEAIMAGRQLDASPSDVSMAQSYAFGELLLPFVVVARRRLRERTSTAIYRRLTPSAHRDIDRALMAELEDLFGDVLLEEFSKVRSPGSDLLARLLGPSASGNSDAQFRRFIANHKSDGLLGLFQRYPVLGRLAATRLGHAVDFACEFLEHLDVDLPELSPSDDCAGGSVIAHLEFGLSDPHEGGRSVVVATAQSGWAIVYKPRSLAPEQAWNDVLTVIDDDLRRPRIINRGTYGWMEYIEPAECADAAEVERFFARVGKLLCGAFVFGGKDFHRDNLIAAGDQPILVDLETLGQPDPRLIATVSDAPAAIHRARNELFSSSVIRAEFLPQWQSATDGPARDDSALSSPADHMASVVEWCALNTDLMTKTRSTRPSPGANLPHLNGVPVRAEDHTEAILTGFTSAWAKLAGMGPQLVSETGPAAAFRQLPFRFIFRGTEIYYRLLQQATASPNLASGVDFSLELLTLHRALIGVAEPRIEALVVAEIDALQRCDIPRFGGSSASDALEEGLTMPLASYFETSGIKCIEQRLARLTPEHLHRELQVISTILAGETSRSRASPAAPRSAASRPLAAFGPEQAIAAASDLGDELLETAFPLPNDGLCWLGLVYREEASGFQAEMLSDSFYDGNAGMALFLAALYRAGSGDRFRDGALRAIMDLRTMIRNTSPADQAACAARMGLGAGAGIGGLVYALVRVGGFLNDRSVIDDARRLSRWVSSDLIAAEREWEVLDGLSGTIGGLLALVPGDPSGQVLMSACECGEHILALLRRADRTRLEPESFAHGTTGAAAHLGRLGKYTENPVFYRAAQDILRRRSRADQAGDGNADPHISFDRTGWCNGVAGQGLARLAALTPGDCVDNPEFVSALGAVRRARAAPADQICCGVFGAVDLLLGAGRTLNRPELHDEAWRLAAAAIDRATAQNGYRLLSGVPVTFRGPSLFQGLAGVGYELLRLTTPERFPSVLTME